MAALDPLVFFGTDAFSVPALQALVAGGYDVRAVITKPDATSGRGRKLTAPAVKEVALEHGLTVLQPAKTAELADMVQPLGAKAGVVVSYGKIIPAGALSVFSQGLTNIHPSLLPRYRGPAPIEAAILNGDAQTGISLMRLDAGMDTGPVYIREAVDLDGTETRASLHVALARRGAELLAENLDEILAGQLVAKPQDAFDQRLASVTNMITKDDAAIDWVKPAVGIARHVRAYAGWPGSKARLWDTEVTITAAHAGDSTPFVGTGETGGRPGTPFKTVHGELAVVTGHGELIIDHLKPAGRTEMTGRAFLAGRRT